MAKFNIANIENDFILYLVCFSINIIANAGRQPQCGIYLLFLLLSFIGCRFGECNPPETARISRLHASLVPDPL